MHLCQSEVGKRKEASELATLAAAGGQPSSSWLAALLRSCIAMFLLKYESRQDVFARLRLSIEIEVER